MDNNEKVEKMKDIKTAFFVATEKGYFCLKKCIEAGYGNNISFVVSFQETNVEKSYDKDIQGLCNRAGIYFVLWKNVKGNIVEICRQSKVSAAFAVGWRFLLPIEINRVTEFGLIVFHDSLLPKYRGFAPTPTAILCGEKKLGVTALLAAEKADQGDVVLQKEFAIGEEDYICDIIKKQCMIYAGMLIEVLEMIEKGALKRKKQNEEDAVYCIWRDAIDCKIDWGMPAGAIRNLVRAVAAPYMGAYCFYKKNKIIVHRAEVADEIHFAIRQCGKIWSISKNQPTVICGRGMLRITEAKYEDGSDVVFDKLRERLDC